MSVCRTIAVIALSFALLGCPPERENIGEGTGGGESFQTSLFALDPYTGSQYELVYFFLIDADYDCNRIIQDYGLSWWNLENGVPWVTAVAYKGQFVEWESTFRSQYLWNQDAVWDYTVADFFSGTYGTGGYDNGDDDDDDDVPPPEPGRDQDGYLGNDVGGADDTLTISSWGEESVRGNIRSVAGDFWFDAESCGYMNGGVIGGEDGAGNTTEDPAGS